MRTWLAIVMMGLAGSAQAAPVERVSMPIASRFDLTRFMMHPVADQGVRIDDSRWLAAEITPPPGRPTTRRWSASGARRSSSG